MHCVCVRFGDVSASGGRGGTVAYDQQNWSIHSLFEILKNCLLPIFVLSRVHGSPNSNLPQSFRFKEKTEFDFRPKCVLSRLQVRNEGHRNKNLNESISNSMQLKQNAYKYQGAANGVCPRVFERIDTPLAVCAILTEREPNIGNGMKDAHKQVNFVAVQNAKR